MTDTQPALVDPPLSWRDWIVKAIGDLARPVAIYSIGFATAYAICGEADAGKVTAAGLLLGALYGAKVYENKEEKKRNAEVEIAKVNAGQTQ